jgi:hypothetical protein
VAISLDTTWSGVADNASGATFVQTGAHSIVGSPTILIACHKLTTAAQPFINFTDNHSSTYNVLGPFGSGGTLLYIGYTISPVPAGSYQIKANFTGTTGKSTICAATFNGITTSSPFDVSSSAIGSGAGPLDSGTAAATGQNDSLLIGFGGLDGGAVITWTAGSGYAKLAEVAVAVDSCMEYQIVSSIGAYKAQLTMTGSNSWQMAMAAFKGITLANSGTMMADTGVYNIQLPIPDVGLTAPMSSGIYTINGVNAQLIGPAGPGGGGQKHRRWGSIKDLKLG